MTVVSNVSTASGGMMSVLMSGAEFISAILLLASVQRWWETLFDKCWRCNIDVTVDI